MSSEFVVGLLDCKNDIKTFAIACLPFGSACIQAKAVCKTQNDEGFCEAFTYSLFLCCIGAGINRKHIREVYDIDGTLFGDVLCHAICPPCSATQEYREVVLHSRQRRSSLRTSVNYYVSMAKT